MLFHLLTAAKPQRDEVQSRTKDLFVRHTRLPIDLRINPSFHNANFRDENGNRRTVIAKLYPDVSAIDCDGLPIHVSLHKFKES